MHESINLSIELLSAAKRAADGGERSIAGQIEFWAQLGRAVEPLLEGSQALAIRKFGVAIPLSERIAEVDSDAGRKRVSEYLETRPYPHYQSVPGKPDLLIRIAQDGTRTLGKFVGREFEAVE